MKKKVIVSCFCLSSSSICVIEDILFFTSSRNLKALKMFVPFMSSNLQNLLRSFTPIVPSKPFLPGDIHDSKNNKKVDTNIEYFTLGDVWKSFDEWSAYGVGSPVVLSENRNVVQYYTPYLSAFQIYTLNSSPTFTRNLKEEGNDIDIFEMECWSDGSDSSVETQASLPIKHKLGHLYFQYQDVSSPYWRIPIAQKIANFSQSYPGLVTLKSYDISPASWMSIAWYPIYEVPAMWSVKDLSTSFLTYHTLSSSFQDSTWEKINGKDGKNIGVACPPRKGQNQVSLPPFGLATYRMQGDVWMRHGKNDHKMLINLYGAADSWLKQLNFDHHDFNFFNMHSNFD